jgi:hypothetical protein
MNSTELQVTPMGLTELQVTSMDPIELQVTLVDPTELQVTQMDPTELQLLQLPLFLLTYNYVLSQYLSTVWSPGNESFFRLFLT